MPEKYRPPYTHERLQAPERMKRDWAAQRQTRVTVRRFNGGFSARGYSWFWPKIVAAPVSKHHWLMIARDTCSILADPDLRVKPRDPEASICVALGDVRCPRCNTMAVRPSLGWRSSRRCDVRDGEGAGKMRDTYGCITLGQRDRQPHD
jgi:hypothetical protein